MAARHWPGPGGPGGILFNRVGLARRARGQSLQCRGADAPRGSNFRCHELTRGPARTTAGVPGPRTIDCMATGPTHGLGRFVPRGPGGTYHSSLGPERRDLPVRVYDRCFHKCVQSNFQTGIGTYRYVGFDTLRRAFVICSESVLDMVINVI